MFEVLLGIAIGAVSAVSFSAIAHTVYAKVTHQPIRSMFLTNETNLTLTREKFEYLLRHFGEESIIFPKLNQTQLNTLFRLSRLFYINHHRGGYEWRNFVEISTENMDAVAGYEETNLGYVEPETVKTSLSLLNLLMMFSINNITDDKKAIHSANKATADFKTRRFKEITEQTGKIVQSLQKPAHSDDKYSQKELDQILAVFSESEKKSRIK